MSTDFGKCLGTFEYLQVDHLQFLKNQSLLHPVCEMAVELTFEKSAISSRRNVVCELGVELTFENVRLDFLKRQLATRCSM